MGIILKRSILGFIVMAFTLLACDSPAYISGRLEGAEGKDIKLYLIQPENLREVGASYFGKVLDSAVVGPDGNFEFTNPPQTQGPVLLELALGQSGKYPNYLKTDDVVRSNYMPFLWQAGAFLEITADGDAFQNSFSIENPSENNKALLYLRDVGQKAYKTYLEGKQWQLEEGSQLLDKEHAILQYQTELIKFADSSQLLMPALVAFRWVSPEDDYERVPEFLVRQCEKWKEKQPGHPWVKQLCERSEPANLPVLVGDGFPNLTLPTITKDTFDLKDVLGDKLTLIDLWASWCAPCRLENREVLVPLWDTYHDKGLQIIAYGLESNASAWKTAMVRDGADRWLQASDLEGDDAPFLKKIRVQTIPANFILDDQGVVVAKNIHGKALMTWVENYLGKE
ncbi:TlpA family protein disulfide reductase [Maribacter polysaccharolyticus]|uniref:TlpA family protein disulfide reductase n=1 Tax=Maribacter polysaccharolyticus TaxID=3020831 RepID=UPI00237F611F|nr:TlpA disulfide reductase family protein [Maribacter polysaccharolyticus]MDE3741995.1 TlpA disulfide reductase family protein [Maribacter polysaccharolyticus]